VTLQDLFFAESLTFNKLIHTGKIFACRHSGWEVLDGILLEHLFGCCLSFLHSVQSQLEMNASFSCTA
jgi:hypothetical protein